MAWATAAAAVASVAMQAYGQKKSADAASQSADYNAQIDRNNAQIAAQNAVWAGQEGVQSASQSGQKTRAQVAGITANQGASGVDISSPSASAVRESAKQAGALDALTIRSNAARRAYGYQIQDATGTAQGALDQASAKNYSSAGNIAAGSTILGGAAKAYESGAFSGYQDDNSVLNSTGTTDNYLSNVG